MDKSPVRIIGGPGRVELLGRSRIISVAAASYDDIVHLFAKPDPNPQEAEWVARVRSLLREPETPRPKERYELGDRIIFADGVCMSCLGRQYPVSSLNRFPLPKLLETQLWEGDRIITMDADGLAAIAPLPETAHAECCPLVRSPLLKLGEETRDESVLEQELVQERVRQIEIDFETYWTLTADFGDHVRKFDGPSKRRVLEDMYAYMLTHYCSYRTLSPGLTVRAAYLNHLNRYGLNGGVEKEQRIFDPGQFSFWMPGPVLFPPVMSYKVIEALMPVYGVEWKSGGVLLRAFGEDLEDALFRLWNRLRAKEGSTEANAGAFRDENWLAGAYHTRDRQNGELPLFRYEDGFSRKYGFALLGGGDDSCSQRTR